MRDLVVAGGGPVGLATALYAARAGLDVVLWEPRRGVVDKACGEGLMPGAVAALTDLGIRLDGHPIRGIRYVDGPRRAEAAFRHGDGRGVRRTTLHAALQDAVREAGVEIVERRVRSLSDRGDHLRGRRRADPPPRRRRRAPLPRAPDDGPRAPGHPTPATRPPAPPGGDAVDLVRRGALVVGRRGLRDAGRARRGRRRRAHRGEAAAALSVDSLSRRSPSGSTAPRRPPRCGAPGRCGSG